jgi:hypothetical protein
MNSTTFAAELARNRAAYEQLREQIRRASPGYAAIAHGRLVAVSATFDEAAAAVQQLRPPAEHFLVFPADEEPAFDLIDDFCERL